MSKQTKQAKNPEFEIDTRVQTPDGEGTIVGYKSGWFSVEFSSGEISKYRAKDLTKAGKVTMAEQLRKYRHNYHVSAGPNGKSLNNGDELARYLEGKDWRQVCELADQVLDVELGFHATKYERLNVGQRRMNAGNRIRAAVKRGDWNVPTA
jgi:hypothetical protein